MARKRHSVAKLFPEIPQRDEKGALPAEFVKEYNSVVESAKLFTITLVDASFKAGATLALRMKTEGDTKFRPSFDGSLVGFDYSVEHGILQAFFEWNLFVIEKRSRELKGKATFCVVYVDVAEVSPSPAFAFVKRVGRYTTYPYFRQLTSNFLSLANIELPPLPVLKD